MTAGLTAAFEGLLTRAHIEAPDHECDTVRIGHTRATVSRMVAREDDESLDLVTSGVATIHEQPKVCAQGVKGSYNPFVPVGLKPGSR